MKSGDLVSHLTSPHNVVGLVIDMTQKKVWRTPEQGNAVDWNKVEPEPHAIVLFPHNCGTIAIPTIELEVFSESG